MRERWLASVLFVATAASVVVVHRWSGDAGWYDSALFATTLLGFLGAHEIGHRAVGRAHGMSVSLPLFLPAPFFVGTLGAVLRVHDRPRTRTALLEMGIAGPIAGWLVLVVACVARTAWSAPSGAGEPLRSPALWSVTSWLIRGEVAPLTTGDPVGYALWVGCLVTAMNLLPFGQLDGGHVMVAT
ncbi:MAG: site-2 protease family protein, partial [Myxococcota bacterium]